MQQFQVPQFITVEDRIIGPFTLKQFFYLLGAVGVGALGWFFLNIVLFIVLAVPLALVLLAMGIGTFQGRPFRDIFMNAVNFYLKPRLYLWKSIRGKPKVAEAPAPAPRVSPLPALPKFSESKLSDLAWSLDIKEKIGERGPSGR